MMYLGSCQVFEMRLFVGIVECISPLMWGRHFAEPFHAFRICCSAKSFNAWLSLAWLRLMCVTGTSWSDVILIWYHYFVICTLVTIFHRSLSSKDMKSWLLVLRELKEALVVFGLPSTQVCFVLCIYIYIYTLHIHIDKDILDIDI